MGIQKKVIVGLFLLTASTCLLVAFVWQFLSQGYLLVNDYSSVTYQQPTSGNLDISWEWIRKKSVPQFLQVAFSASQHLHNCAAAFDGDTQYKIQRTCYKNRGTCSGEDDVTEINIGRYLYLIVARLQAPPIIPFDPHVVRLTCDEGYSEWKIEKEDL